MKWTLRLFSFSLLLLLTACGGGSGGGGSEPDPTPTVTTIEVAALSDQIVSEGELVTVTVSLTQGSVSDLDFDWSVVSSSPISFEGQGSNRITFTAPSVEQTSVISIQVTLTLKEGTLVGNNLLFSSVYVMNAEPVAFAGFNQQVTQTSAVTLDGSLSTDDKDDIIRYQWTQTAGTNVTLENADQSIATFTAPLTTTASESLEFELEVEDGQGYISSDRIIVEVLANQAPTAVFTAVNEIDENSVVDLDASASTDDIGVASVTWSQVSGPEITFEDAQATITSFVAPLVTELTTVEVMLTVADAQGLESTSTKSITVNPTDLRPVAESLSLSATTERQTVEATVNAYDPDGEIVSWVWRQSSGPIVEFDGQGTNTISFVAPDLNNLLETVIFTLNLTDDDGLELLVYPIRIPLRSSFTSNQFLYPVNNSLISGTTTSLSGYLKDDHTIDNTLLGEPADYSGLEVTITSGDNSQTVTTDEDGFWHVPSFEMSIDDGKTTLSTNVAFGSSTIIEESMSLTVTDESNSDPIDHATQYASLIAGGEGINLYFVEQADESKLKRLSLADNVVTDISNSFFDSDFNQNIIGYYSNAPSYERLDKLISLESETLRIARIDASSFRSYANVEVESDVFSASYIDDLIALSPTKLFVQDGSEISNGSSTTATVVTLPMDYGNYTAMDVDASADSSVAWVTADGFQGILNIDESTGAITQSIDLSSHLADGDMLKDIVIDDGKAYVLIANRGIAAVELADQSFSWLSNADVGTGIAFSNPLEMTISANKKVLYVSDDGIRVLLIEIATGNRVIIAS